MLTTQQQHETLLTSFNPAALYVNKPLWLVHPRKQTIFSLTVSAAVFSHEANFGFTFPGVRISLQMNSSTTEVNGVAQIL